MEYKEKLTQKLAFIGFGEVPSTFYATGLGEVENLEVIVCIPIEKRAWGIAHEYLQEANLTASEDPAVLRGIPTIFSLVPPTAALAVAQKVSPYLDSNCLYVDMNSVAGPTSIGIGKTINKHGGRYVDAAIMGPVPLLGLEVPIAISGPDANEFLKIAHALGLNVSVLSTRTGDASSLKMLWSVITKGVIALYTEALTAAHRLDLVQPIIELLREQFGNTGSERMILRLLKSTAQSGLRRLDEMEEVKLTLQSVAVPARTIESTMEWIESLSKMSAARDAQNVYDVITAISEELAVE